MRKIIPILILILVIAGISCSDMNDLHDKYLAGGETIYLAKFDSLAVHGGRERVKVIYWLSDPKVTSTQVTWNMGENSQEFEVRRTGMEEPAEFYIDNLSEGSYSFSFVNYNPGKDLHSVVTEISATVYGNAFQVTLINTKPANFKYNEADDIYSFQIKTKYEGAIAYNLKFENKEGKMIEKRYSVEDLTDESTNKMTLPLTMEDLNDDKRFSLQSVFLPEENCIDEFYTDYTEFTVE